MMTRGDYAELSRLKLTAVRGCTENAVPSTSGTGPGPLDST